MGGPGTFQQLRAIECRTFEASSPRLVVPTQTTKTHSKLLTLN
jgi:hypothetical protein